MPTEIEFQVAAREGPWRAEVLAILREVAGFTADVRMATYEEEQAAAHPWIWRSWVLAAMSEITLTPEPYPRISGVAHNEGLRRAEFLSELAAGAGVTVPISGNFEYQIAAHEGLWKAEVLACLFEINGGPPLVTDYDRDMAVNPKLWWEVIVGLAEGVGGGGISEAVEASLLLLIPTEGLYKDTAGTIPATLAGDKIAAWKDMRNGLMFTQATVANQPTLQFVEGKPVVRFGGGVASTLVLSHNFPGITVNSSGIFGYYPGVDSYTIFDGPNGVPSTYTRYGPTGMAFAGLFLSDFNTGAFMPVPASGKMVMSISSQEASYNGRINGAQIVSAAARPVVNTGSAWTIGVNSALEAGTYYTGDIFGIAIYSTPPGTSHADHTAGVADIEDYISGFYPDAAPPTADSTLITADSTLVTADAIP